MTAIPAWLAAPSKLWSWAEIAGSVGVPPKKAGVYGWYFDYLPSVVPVAQCHVWDGRFLAYIGISPKAPPKNGSKPSSQTLRSRLVYHFRGNAEGSTLRLTLGCLLSEELGIALQRTGSGKRLTFAEGEQRLSAWMEEHARVVFTEHPRPWEHEEELIGSLDLPLNLDQNSRHPFHPTLSAIRKAAKKRARELEAGK